MAYAIVNLSYSLIFKPIYPVLTWKDKKSYLLIAGSILFSLLHFVVGYYFARKFKKTKELTKDELEDALL